MGDAARLPATGDNIIRPVFDGCIKTGETGETRTTERKKEKNCKLGVSGRTSDFNIIIGRLDLNSLVRSFGTRNFVR